MSLKTIKNSVLNEVIHMYEHSSGLKVFVIPKEGYSKKYATFSVHYGSIDNKFIIDKDDKITEVPLGIAHFLEHKLFEQEDENVMDAFSKLGARCNAYTSSNQTVYLFSCVYNFIENFKLLLHFVQNPHFTSEEVEKEKGIITQEINMYKDMPQWVVYFNLLDALYKNHPVKLDIAGSAESISHINKDLLYTCYKAFYVPTNMAIVVCGDINPSEVFDEVDKNLNFKYTNPCAKKIFTHEGLAVNKQLVTQNMHVSSPIFLIGFKDNVSDLNAFERIKRDIVINILFEIIMGESSPLYNDLYSCGLINSSFSFNYTIEEDYGFSSFGGESPHPLQVQDKVSSAIKELLNNGLDNTTFERLLKKSKGAYIKIFNSVEGVAKNFISLYFNNINLFDYVEAYNSISIEYANKILHQHFSLDKMAMSLINNY